MESGIPDQVTTGDLVHLVWDGRFDLARKWEIHYIRSTNGGINWSPNIVLSDSDQFHSVLPSICTDGLIQIGVSWMDYKYSPYMGTGDILCRMSTDFGQTWGSVKQASNDHFAWNSDIASNGDTIHIIWVDEGTGIGHRSIYYTRSTDYGENWSEPYWIDGTLDDSADPALAISDGKVYCIWQDGRANPDTNIRGGLYIRRWDPENDAINEGQDNLPIKANLLAYPNPFNSSTTLTVSSASNAEISIFDISGRQITSLKAENGKAIWDAIRFSSGIYFARAGAKGGGQTIKLILLK
jgi:hypothetical protein